MDKEEFLKSIETTSKFIVEYYDKTKTEKVLPNVTPGYLETLVESECPENGADFDSIFSEFKEKIMVGVTNWASPHCHSYFPAGNSFPSMTAELLIAGINNVGINWEMSPATTELEIVVMDWLAKMFNLPEHFLNSSIGPGGGLFQNTATESTLLSLLAARNRALKKYKELHPGSDDKDILPKLVAYTSGQSHFSVERVGKILAIRTWMLQYESDGKLSGQTLKNAIETDIANDLIPCFMVGAMGATTTCSWDDLEELGEICNQYDIWLHVDAAYSGSALVCPELRYISQGIHRVDSIAIGLHKWFLMSLDVVAYWSKDFRDLSDTISVDRLYLKHKHFGSATDFVNYQIGNGRKFKALKVWMVLKNYGVKGMQEHIRRHVMLGQYMEKLMKTDNRFEIIASGFGLVAFMLKAGDYQTEQLRTLICNDTKISLTPCHFKNKYVIRFVVNFTTRSEHVDYAWDVIKKAANDIEKTCNKNEESIDNLIANLQETRFEHLI